MISSGLMANKDITATIQDYLEHRLGISKRNTNAFFRAMGEYMLLQLSRRTSLFINNIGEFTLDTKHKRWRIKYSPSRTLSNKIDKEQVESKRYINVVKAMKRDINVDWYELAEDNSDKLKEALRYEYADLRITNNRDYLRYSLIAYMQRSYPHHSKWRHPLTNKVYSWDEMNIAVKLIKELAPSDYKILLTVWVSIANRRLLCQRWRMKTRDYWAALQDLTDMFLMLLELPALDAEEIRDILG